MLSHARSWWGRFAQMVVFCALVLFALQVAPFRQNWGTLLWIVTLVFVQWASREKVIDDG